jgi:hypothetical protein
MRASSARRKSLFFLNSRCNAHVSLRMKSSSISGRASFCNGALAPPSRNDPASRMRAEIMMHCYQIVSRKFIPAEPSMSTIGCGATIQHTRNPGQRQFFVSPFMIITGSISTSSTKLFEMNVACELKSKIRNLGQATCTYAALDTVFGQFESSSAPPS